jgi:4-amino-4-deoxy-L-arabinose transferase-like glycosyltransferase
LGGGSGSWSPARWRSPFAISAAWVLARRNHPLLGDAPEYDLEGRFIAAGKWWWSASPYGVPHASAWKAPLYPAWVGILYAIIGNHHVRVEMVQAIVLAPITVVLTWWLARRLFGPRVAVVAALLVAVYPAIWQWNGLLYSETLALLLLVTFLDRTPTARWAAGVGALLGLNLLLRPTSILFAAGIVTAWLVACGLKRGAKLSAVTLVVAVLVVVPWTIRNAVVEHGFLPISLQDVALAYGTFNDDAANDPVYPYGWRAVPRSFYSFYDRKRPLPDLEFHARIQHLAASYIKEHPGSLLGRSSGTG